MNKKIIAIMVLFILSLTLAVHVNAQSPESFNLPVQKTLPGSTSYKVKRFKEKIIEFFKIPGKGKFTYRQILLEKRVSEYVSLIANKNEAEIANASQRVAYEAGVLAENSYNEAPENKDLIIQIFEKYKPILEKMRDNFPANSPFWLLSQQDIDTFNILSGRLK